MQALHDVVQAGYVRYIGMSSCHAWRCTFSSSLTSLMTDSIRVVHKMQNYAKTHNLTQFISVQNFHCPVYREEEREMAPLLKDLGVGMTPWAPLAGGFTASPYKPAANQGEGTVRQETD